MCCWLCWLCCKFEFRLFSLIAQIVAGICLFASSSFLLQRVQHESLFCREEGPKGLSCLCTYSFDLGDSRFAETSQRSSTNTNRQWCLVIVTSKDIAMANARSSLSKRTRMQMVLKRLRWSVFLFLSLQLCFAFCTQLSCFVLVAYPSHSIRLQHQQQKMFEFDPLVDDVDPVRCSVFTSVAKSLTLRALTERFVSFMFF